MINLEMVLKKYPAPHPGVVIEQRIADEGWLQFCMYASNLADFSDPKRQNIITWAFDVCEKITKSGNPIQLIIYNE